MSKIVLISLYNEFTLGERYISSFLQQHGHQADLLLFKHCLAVNDVPKEKQDPEDYLEYFYASRQEIQLMLDFIKDRNPLWVGFSFMSVASGLAVELTKRIRQVSSVPIVWGGVDTTVNPEWAMEHADIICVGEGEYAALELTEALEGKRDLYSIQNLWVRRDGEIIKNPIRPLIQDLDSLPFPNFDDQSIWHIHENQIYQGIMADDTPLKNWFIQMTSRGCPYRCSFCIHSTGHEMSKGKGKYLRRRSVENVIAELVAYKKKRPNTSQIMFYDDVFTFDKKWIAEFAEAYKREVNIPFWVYSYPEICTPEMITQLRDIGLLYVNMGIQSGSPSVLKELYDRTPNTDTVVKAAYMLKDLGVHAVFDILVGLPLEKEEQLWESLDLLLQLPAPFGLNVWPLIYYRNYKLTNMLNQTEHAGSLEPVNGVNAEIYSRENPYMRFWLTIMRLVRYAEIPREEIRSMVDNQALREDPTPIEILERALFKAAFVENTVFTHKDSMMQQLQNENALLRAQLDNVQKRKFFKVQSVMDKLIGRNVQMTSIATN
jgi:anaerobic magnesium-protoporphyrin IX monomethyl ester cyclase